MGIYLSHSNQLNSPINWKNIIFLFSLAQISLNAVFLLSEAETAVEYGFSFYTFNAGSTSAAAVLICIWKKGNMNYVLQNFENFIEKSMKKNNLKFYLMNANKFHFLVSFLQSIGNQKSAQKMYNELNERIEGISKLFHLILVKWSTPVVMIPPLITSLVKFYILNLDANESFLLPFPNVYVFD